MRVIESPHMMAWQRCRARYSAARIADFGGVDSHCSPAVHTNPRRREWRVVRAVAMVELPRKTETETRGHGGDSGRRLRWRRRSSPARATTSSALPAKTPLSSSPARLCARNRCVTVLTVGAPSSAHTGSCAAPDALLSAAPRPRSVSPFSERCDRCKPQVEASAPPPHVSGSGRKRTSNRRS